MNATRHASSTSSTPSAVTASRSAPRCVIHHREPPHVPAVVDQHLRAGGQAGARRRPLDL
jgi:hypothetical protein